MATTKGVNQTLIDAGGLATIAAGLCPARVKARYDQITVSAETTGDIIKLFGPLPAGAKILQIIIESSVTQASATLSIGDLGSASRYGSGIILTTGTTGTHAQSYAGKGYVIGTTTTAATDDTQILLTVAGGTVTAATWYAVLIYATD
jgi:hypothetical protein